MGLYFGNGLANNINGSDNADIIYGYGADDILNGGLGDDQILGGNGNDLLIGGAGADFLSGGSGSDTADYSGNLADVFISLDHRFGDGRGFGGTAEGDHLVGIENVIGGDGSDDLRGDDNGNILMGGEGEDYLRGFGGNDQLIGGADGDWMFGGTGGDHFDGGQGNDRAIYSDSDAAVTINLALFTASGGDADGDTLQGVEELTGSRYNDDLTGDVQENSFNGLKGNDKLYGLAGDDGLWGDDGNDILEGGADSDYLHGGDGVDTASYRYAAEGVSVSLDGVNLHRRGSGRSIDLDRAPDGQRIRRYSPRQRGRRSPHRPGGNDMLFALDGDDDLFGGQGQDHLGAVRVATILTAEPARMSSHLTTWPREATRSPTSVRALTSSISRAPGSVIFLWACWLRTVFTPATPARR